jgi:anti-anti-sigma regulatory factor
MSDDPGGIARIPLQISRDCVVASIQVDLSDIVLRRFRRELLELVQTSGARGVILDVSGIEVMDYEDFEALRRTMAMARLMGAPSVAVMDLDDAFRIMDQPRAETESGGDEGEDDERLHVASPDQL